MQNIQLYIPNIKKTIITQPPISKFVFDLNYKGLQTNRTLIHDNIVTIEFSDFEAFKKNISKWQISATPIWEFFKKFISIELILIDDMINHPYLPIIRFHLDKANDFYLLFTQALK